MCFSTKKFKEDKFFSSKLFLTLEKIPSKLEEMSNENSISKSETNFSSQNDSKSIRNFLTKELLDSIDFSISNETKNENDNLNCLYCNPQINYHSFNFFINQNVSDNLKKYKNNHVEMNNSVKKKKTQKKFESREGDWNCYFCKNLNFSFRKKCNKCGILKKDSESLHDKCMENVLFIINKNQKTRNEQSAFI
jgi:hypothetical protein